MTSDNATLEEAVAGAIAQRLTGGKVYVLSRRDLARHAALDAFREGIRRAVQVLGEMALNQEQGGDTAGAELLREGQRQIATLPDAHP